MKKETKQKIRGFFNKLNNYIKGLKCPKCGHRWVRNYSYATKTSKAVHICSTCNHVFGVPKKEVPRGYE